MNPKTGTGQGISSARSSHQEVWPMAALACILAVGFLVTSEIAAESPALSDGPPWVVDRESPLHLYVSPEGSDDHSCLSVETPCHTIQAAVDLIPSQVRWSVTVHIGPGTYADEPREYIYIQDRLLPTTTADQPVIHLVGEGAPPLLRTGLYVENVRHFVLENVTVDASEESIGLLCRRSDCDVSSCSFRNTRIGVSGASASRVNIHDSDFANHGLHGVVSQEASVVSVRNGSIINSELGISAYRGSVSVQGPFSITGRDHACFVRYGGLITFYPEYGTIEVNKGDPGGPAISVSFGGIVRRYDDVEFNVTPQNRCSASTGGICHPY